MIDVKRESLVNLKEAAEHARVSVKTLRNHIDAGQLEVTRAGVRIRTSIEAIGRWMARCDKIAARHNKSKATPRIEADDVSQVESLRSKYGI